MYGYQQAGLGYAHPYGGSRAHGPPYPHGAAYPGRPNHQEGPVYGIHDGCWKSVGNGMPIGDRVGPYGVHRAAMMWVWVPVDALPLRFRATCVFPVNGENFGFQQNNHDLARQVRIHDVGR